MELDRTPRSVTTPFEHQQLTIAELAAYFKVTTRTVQNWMRNRYIPFTKVGGIVRFRLGSVLAYLDASHMVKPRPDVPGRVVRQMRLAAVAVVRQSDREMNARV